MMTSTPSRPCQAIGLAGKRFRRRRRAMSGIPAQLDGRVDEVDGRGIPAGDPVRWRSRRASKSRIRSAAMEVDRGWQPSPRGLRNVRRRNEARIGTHDLGVAIRHQDGAPIARALSQRVGGARAPHRPAKTRTRPKSPLCEVGKRAKATSSDAGARA